MGNRVDPIVRRLSVNEVQHKPWHHLPHAKAEDMWGLWDHQHHPGHHHHHGHHSHHPPGKHRHEGGSLTAAAHHDRHHDTRPQRPRLSGNSDAESLHSSRSILSATGTSRTLNPRSDGLQFAELAWKRRSSFSSVASSNGKPGGAVEIAQQLAVDKAAIRTSSGQQAGGSIKTYGPGDLEFYKKKGASASDAISDAPSAVPSESGSAHAMKHRHRDKGHQGMYGHRHGHPRHNRSGDADAECVSPDAEPGKTSHAANADTCDKEVERAMTPTLQMAEEQASRRRSAPKPQHANEFSDVDYLAIFGLGYWF